MLNMNMLLYNLCVADELKMIHNKGLVLICTNIHLVKLAYARDSHFQ